MVALAWGAVLRVVGSSVHLQALRDWGDPKLFFAVFGSESLHRVQLPL